LYEQLTTLENKQAFFLNNISITHIRKAWQSLRLGDAYNSNGLAYNQNHHRKYSKFYYTNLDDILSKMYSMLPKEIESLKEDWIRQATSMLKVKELVLSQQQ
jgi:hypothetical protein